MIAPNGNIVRRFFDNADLSANITGIDIEIIRRFHIVLQIISNGFKINQEKFKVYTRETAQVFVNKYPWYPMPPTAHKILVHGPEVIDKVLLLIGHLSEETQEARNENFKEYREKFYRKFSRLRTNEDVLYLLLISSDPYILSMRPLPKKKFRKFPNEVITMLESPKIVNNLETCLPESSKNQKAATN